MRKEWKDVSGFGNGKENSITGRLFRGTVTIRSNTTITENIKHPGELLRKILAENKSPRIKGQPSFTGGLVGYFSYDYIRYAEPVLDFGDEGAEDFKDLDLISLIAPTSHERIAMIAKEAKGFVYCVSSLGVTGVRSSITTDVGAMTSLVKKVSDIPCAIGFGISTPKQAADMAQKADGVIVGSAIVKLCGQYGKDCVPYVAEYVKSMKDAIRN